MAAQLYKSTVFRFTDSPMSRELDPEFDAAEVDCAAAVDVLIC